jgi:exodeoxyribonuclease-3
MALGGSGIVRIVTWNVNSLKMRLDRVCGWLERAQPDVLLMQETKLTDAAAPTQPFAERGYELAHFGEGRWNGVAIASRVGISDVVTNFGRAAAVASTAEAPDDHQPLREARMIAASCGGVRVVSLYAPNGRSVDSVFYQAKLGWYGALLDWLRESCKPDEPLVLGGDYNVAPADGDVWDPVACQGGTHVSPKERAAFEALLEWGLRDSYRDKRAEPGRFSWWDYRAGCFQKNMGMRIDHLLTSAPAFERIVWAEIDREARKGKPTPSDHAPVMIDLDSPGKALDAGWEGAEARIAARRKS